MVKFKDDESLGKVVAKMQMFCSIGVDPLKKVTNLAFAAGARKFSCLCGIDFTTANESAQYKHFTIAFVSKLRSKIYRKATANPSQWFIFRKINPIRVDVLDKKALLVNYGFDIDKFFDSDLFNKALPQFERYIKAGLDDAEQFKAKLEKTDPAQAKDAQRYITAIKEALPLLRSHTCNDKYWKLIDYDVRNESENKMNESIDIKDVPQQWIDFCNELNAKIETNVKVLVGKYFKDYPNGSKLVDSIMANIKYLMFDEDGYNEAGNLYEEYFHTVLNDKDYKLEADKNVDEAGKQKIEKRKNTGGKAFIRGCMKILLTIIALTSSTVGLTGMLITWLTGLLTNCCNKLNNRLNDADVEEVKLDAKQSKEVSKAYADASKEVPDDADAEEVKEFLSKNKSALDKLQSNDKLPDEAKKNIKQIIDFLSNTANGNATEAEIDEKELDDKIEEAMKKIYDAEADRKEEDKKLEA